MVLDQFESFLVMILFPFGLADIVQKGGGEQAEASRSCIDRRLPLPTKKPVVDLKRQACHVLGVRKIGIKSVRPDLHPTACQLLNLLTLRKRVAPYLPPRIL